MSFYFPSWGMQVGARAELLDRVVKSCMEKQWRKSNTAAWGVGMELGENKPDEKDVWGLLLFCCGV